MKQKKLEDIFIFPDLRKKSLIIRFLIFIFDFVIFIPIIFSVQEIYSIEVTLAWNMRAVDGLAGFRVFCREEGQDYDYKNPAWEGNDLTCIIGNLKEGTPYHFVVRAYSRMGDESDNSNEIYFVSLNKYNNENVKIYNKLNGKWEPLYLFFKKLSGKEAFFDKIEISIFLKNGNEWKLYKR